MDAACKSGHFAGKSRESPRHNFMLCRRTGAALLCFILTGLSGANAEINAGTPSKFMRHEHNQIYARIERLSQTPGKTGNAAKNLLTVMRPHMFSEEEIVLPELGVLKEVALGGSTEGMTGIVVRSEKLEKEYPRMLADHKAIFTAIDKLSTAAALEADQGALDLAAQLKAHLQDEEEIVYPAAILTGKYIKGHPQ